MTQDDIEQFCITFILLLVYNQVKVLAQYAIRLYSIGSLMIPERSVDMGIYLNPGNENFTEITRAEIYVDKTMMIDVMNRFIDKDKTHSCRIERCDIE